MRFSLAVVAAALPALAAAQGVDEYVAKFQNFIGDMGSKIPHYGIHDPVAALEAKLGSMKLHILTLNNWQETLFETVPAGTTKPVEWWVLISGRNKTCSGRCERLEQAFNETAAKFAVLPGAPYVGYVNCDDQPILCSSWIAGAGHIWAFDMVPNVSEIEVYRHRFNVSTVTSDDMVALRTDNKENHEAWSKIDSYFKPFNGKAAELGLAVPAGWVLWFFNIFPSWAFMLVVSFTTRSMMSRRMNDAGQAGQPAR